MTTSRDLLDQLPLLADVVPVDDYLEIREVLGSPDFVQGAYQLTRGNLLHDVLTTLDGDDHRHRRRIMARLFSASALETYREDHLRPVIAHTLAEAATDRGADGVVRTDLVPLLWRITFRVAAAVTGIDDLDTVERVSRFIDLVGTFGRSLTVEWSKLDHDALIAEGLQARADLDAEFIGPSARRRQALVDRYRSGELGEDDLPRDLVTMLELHRDPAWDDELPLREVAVFLMAATQTTTQAFPHMIVQLETWLAANPSYRPMISADETFLRRAAYETLRLFVASPARIRRATRDVVLASGRVVPEGTRLALFFRPASSDPAVFGHHADRFDPLRELPQVAPWGLAFGGGTHMCVGRPLVTGVGSRGESDGTVVLVARALYEAGLTLDPDHPPVRDDTTFYDAYESVPVILRSL